MLYYDALFNRVGDLCCIIKYWLTDGLICAVLTESVFCCLVKYGLTESVICCLVQ